MLKINSLPINYPLMPIEPSREKPIAVFFDRDGVINVSEKPDGSFLPVNKPEDLIIFENAKIGLSKLAQVSNLLLILVTNQGGIGAGFMTEEALKAINQKLTTEISASGGRIDKIYYCTTNDKKDPMRKPNPGMILEAEKDFDIDLKKSYMIGDMTTDIACGENADSDVTSILVETGSGGKDGKINIKSDVICKNFEDAAEYIIKDLTNKKLVNME